MTKEEAVSYCYKHRDEYIKDTGSIDDGIRQFDCLISILEDGTIRPDQLAEYGMEYDEKIIGDDSANDDPFGQDKEY